MNATEAVNDVSDEGMLQARNEHAAMPVPVEKLQPPRVAAELLRNESRNTHDLLSIKQLPSYRGSPQLIQVSSPSS